MFGDETVAEGRRVNEVCYGGLGGEEGYEGVVYGVLVFAVVLSLDVSLQANCIVGESDDVENRL